MQPDQIRALSEAWQETEFTIGGTTFHVTKMNAMDSFEVLELIRTSSASALVNADATGTVQETVASLISGVLSIPRSNLRQIREELFREVRFTNKIARTKMVLYQNEHKAFNGLLPTHVYEVLARCLCVNFTESVSDILRRAGAEI